MSYLKLLRQSKARRKVTGDHGEGEHDLPVSQCEEAGDLTALSVSSADHQRLEEADYKPKISFGKQIIWERPDTGFYVSQEIALHLLDTKNVRDKSGANERK